MKQEFQNKEKELHEKKQAFERSYQTIHLRYEYPQYTGKERFAIVTDETEEELRKTFGEVMDAYYSPFLLLRPCHWEAICEHRRNEHKHEMRAKRSGCAFDINDGTFEEHHPEFAVQEDWLEAIQLKTDIEKLHRAFGQLDERQKSRIKRYFFEEKTLTEIAEQEGVSRQAVKYSIEVAVKKLRKFMD